MIFFKIGDAIISEQMFIGVQLSVDAKEDKVIYSYEALWQYGNRVESSVVYRRTIDATSDAYTEDEMEKHFRIAYENMEWNPFAEGE